MLPGSFVARADMFTDDYRIVARILKIIPIERSACGGSGCRYHARRLRAGQTVVASRGHHLAVGRRRCRPSSGPRAGCRIAAAFIRRCSAAIDAGRPVQPLQGHINTSTALSTAPAFVGDDTCAVGLPAADRAPHAGLRVSPAAARYRSSHPRRRQSSGACGALGQSGIAQAGWHAGDSAVRPQPDYPAAAAAVACAHVLRQPPASILVRHAHLDHKTTPTYPAAIEAMAAVQRTIGTAVAAHQLALGAPADRGGPIA